MMIQKGLVSGENVSRGILAYQPPHDDDVCPMLA